jgi:hypothetical protein
MNSLPDAALPDEEPPASSRSIAGLISQALKLRSSRHYALHPVEAVIQYHRDPAEISGDESHGGLNFEQAETHYRAGAQGIRLSEIPQLPQQLRELSRLSVVSGYDEKDENRAERRRIGNLLASAVIRRDKSEGDEFLRETYGGERGPAFNKAFDQEADAKR